MRKSRIFATLVCSLGLTAAGCSKDEPVANAERGGMGAGRPDTTGASVEDSAVNILPQVNLPAHEDTTRAGARSMTGMLRDSLHHGEATGVKQPQPPRAEAVKRPGSPISQ